MSDGLTYGTITQAQTAKDDFINRGYEARIEKTPDGKWKVYKEESLKFNTGPTMHKEQTIVDIKEMEEPEEFTKDYDKIYKPVNGPYKGREIKHGSEESMKQEYWEKLQGEKEKAKHKQRESEVRMRKTAIKGVSTFNEETKNAFKSPMGNVKRGMKESIPGMQSGSRARLAALPTKDAGAIGNKRAMISQIGPVQKEMGMPMKKTSGFEIVPKGKSLKADVTSKKLTA